MRGTDTLELLIQKHSLGFTKLTYTYEDNKYEYDHGYMIHANEYAFEITLEPINGFCGGIFLNNLYMDVDQENPDDENNTYRKEDIEKYYPFFKELIDHLREEGYSFIHYISAEGQECARAVNDFLSDFKFKVIHEGINKNSMNHCKYWMLNL